MSRRSQPPFAGALQALRQDLIKEDGAQISTMRSYRFAIVPCPPEDEFRLRRQVQALVTDLTAAGWVVHTISLQKLLLKRLRALGDDQLQRMMEMERRTAQNSPERGLNSPSSSPTWRAPRASPPMWPARFATSPPPTPTRPSAP